MKMKTARDSLQYGTGVVRQSLLDKPNKAKQIKVINAVKDQAPLEQSKWAPFLKQNCASVRAGLRDIFQK